MSALTEAQNQSAAKQLGVAESYTAFTASTSLDLLDDTYRHDLNQLEDDGDFSADDVIHIVEMHTKTITLPAGFMYVGMESENRKHRIFGIVNLN
jgi:cupin superfamily acireductone dioxygenase involved in methionine salvage